MSVRAVALCSSMIVTGLVWAQDGTLDFKEFTSKDGKYKVLVSGVMKVSESKATLKGKPAADTVFHSATSDVGPGRQFAVTYFDLPAALGQAEQRTLLSMIGAELKADEWNVLSDKVTTIGKDKLFAQDVLAEKGKVHQRQRVVLFGKRNYQVIVTGPKDFVTSKDADRFVESFEITK